MTFITPYIQTCQCFWYANSAPDSLKIEERGPKAKSCGYAGRLRKLGPALRWHPARKWRSQQGFYSTNNLNKQGPGGSRVKTRHARDTGLIPGSGRSLGGGNGNPLLHTCLGNPMNRGAWRATVHAVTKSQIGLKWLGSVLQRGTQSCHNLMSAQWDTHQTSDMYYMYISLSRTLEL